MKKVTEKQAKAALKKALRDLDKNNSIDVTSFSYGFLLGVGVDDETACYISDSISLEHEP